MRITWQDGLATVLVAAAVALYGLWLGGTVIFGLAGPRGLAAVILGLGITACLSARSHLADVYGAGTGPRPPLPYVVLVSALGAVALVAAIIALLGGSTAALAALVAAMVALWAAATVRHLTAAPARRTRVGR
jgi:hypothetical protein